MRAQRPIRNQHFGLLELYSSEVADKASSDCYQLEAAYAFSQVNKQRGSKGVWDCAFKTLPLT